jgi:YfiH family protein
MPSRPLPPWLIAFTTTRGCPDFKAGAASRAQPPQCDALAPGGLAGLEGAASRSQTTGARAWLASRLEPLTLQWLALEHGAKVALIDEPAAGAGGRKAMPDAVPGDAALIRHSGQAVACTTADCLPIVVYSNDERCAALIHAGWRGLAAGVIGEALSRMARVCPCPHTHTHTHTHLAAWIGPGIGQEDYEVGGDVRDALLGAVPSATACFKPSGRPGRWLADIKGIARAQLSAHGVDAAQIEAHPASTCSDPRFHSHRRDGASSGRMATLVGIACHGPQSWPDMN